jgi:multiple sugar transport system substrate-binding protein
MTEANGNRVLKGMTWDHARGYDPLVATSEQFAEAHEGVRILWEKRSLQAFADRPLEAMAADYDLMVIDHPHVGSAARSGLLLPFDGTGADDALAVLAAQSCGVSHASYEHGGRQWALAIDAAAPVSAYRPDLLDEVPSSWKEVIALSELGRVIWPLLPINALMSFFNLLANMGEPFGAGGNGATAASGRAVLGEMLAVARNLPAECFSMDPIGAYEWLSCRSSHGYVPYLYGYSNYSRAGFRPYLVRVADVPALGRDGPAGSTIGGTGIAISSGCRHPEVAREYAFWIASADCQRAVYFRSGGQPANVVAWEDAACNAASHDFFRDTRKTLELAYLRPRHDGYMAFQDIGGRLVHACLTRRETVEKTVHAINEAYARSLPGAG